MEFEGVSVLVTGGGSGLGLACARRFLTAGARVTILGRTEGRLARAREVLTVEAPPGATVAYVVTDVTDEEAVARAVEVATRDAPLAAAVHSAGQGWAAPIAALPLEAWRLVIDVNMTGCFLTLKHCARHLAATGGAFTAISSVNSALPARFLSSYSAAKAGMDMFVRAAANELGPAGVRVNSVLPGIVPTELSEDVAEMAEIRQDFLDQMPLGRVGTPEDVAEAVYFLSSSRAAWVTGVNLSVDGGHHLRRAQDFDPWVRREHPDAPDWWGVRPA